MKKRVGLIFGGQSPEHEISIQSATSVLRAINREKYDVVPIAIDKDGKWHLESMTGKEICLFTEDIIDVAFPLLHGPLGEDGTVQGLLKLAGIPCVGSDVLGSAIAMDKDVMKRLLRDAGIPSPRFCALQTADVEVEAIVEELGLPLFVKPANMGSSVGISKVTSKEGVLPAIQEALLYDRKVMIEEAISGREIECAVLGNEAPVASLPGEIIPHRDFYSYEAKYIDKEGATLVVPAKLDKCVVEEIRSLSVQAFTTLCCDGMARVDFFIREDGKVFVNELNTIPGFTKISLYPRMWEASGVSYEELIDRLIQLAIMRSTTAAPTSAASPL